MPRFATALVRPPLALALGLAIALASSTAHAATAHARAAHARRAHARATGVAVPPTAPAPVAALPILAPLAPANTSAPGSASLRAFLDPETGQITTTTIPLAGPADLQSTVDPSMLKAVRMPNGSLMVDLQGTMQEYYVLERDPLGRLVPRCVQGPPRAASHVVPVAPARPVAPVER